ncbi:hypothetical protein NDU88_004858 [Pleurodeles waltl]|uniref:Uncharacterized protein n=1 Tax=Pleurodeles waltl TaxID=8319 RepID=A0AAV7WT47_PLEWA|nr:hypothetical protein NDU88_004858 [Pleurodeles waltl]
MAFLLLHQLTIRPGLRPHPPRRAASTSHSPVISYNYSPRPGQQKQHFQAFTCRSGPCALAVGHLAQDTARPGHTYHAPSQATPPWAYCTADREPHSSVLGKAPSPGAQRQAGAASLPPLPRIGAPPPVLGPGMAALSSRGQPHQVRPRAWPSGPAAPVLSVSFTWTLPGTSVGRFRPPTAPASAGPHHAAVTTALHARQRRAWTRAKRPDAAGSPRSLESGLEGNVELRSRVVVATETGETRGGKLLPEEMDEVVESPLRTRLMLDSI